MVLETLVLTCKIWSNITENSLETMKNQFFNYFLSYCSGASTVSLTKTCNFFNHLVRESKVSKSLIYDYYLKFIKLVLSKENFSKIFILILEKATEELNGPDGKIFIRDLLDYILKSRKLKLKGEDLMKILEFAETIKKTNNEIEPSLINFVIKKFFKLATTCS